MKVTSKRKRLTLNSWSLPLHGNYSSSSADAQHLSDISPVKSDLKQSDAFIAIMKVQKNQVD
jgi:hypothetical protein